jgi:tRNA(Leu) C34 or U34 (ribose-2'-O)-methylase TrmL
MDKPWLVGKNTKPCGIVPAIALINPKYAQNVSMVVRLASCWDIKQVWFTGHRVELDLRVGKNGKTRLPREERMKGYASVELRQFDYFFDCFSDAVPVAIEVRDNSENLFDFEHPENALYVFGPEDGSIPKVSMGHCHRSVIVNSRHCLNLATAVATVLYDRCAKLYRNGAYELTDPGQFEQRGLDTADGEPEGLVVQS